MAGTSALVLLILGIVASTHLARVSRVSLPEGPRNKRHRPLWDGRIVDVADLVPIMVLLGIAGVALLGVIAWYVSRKSTEPLEKALEVQRAFVADASHELRTPLTTLNSRIQLAQRKLAQGEDPANVLSQARGDADVLSEVLNDLLLAAETAGDDHALDAVAEVAVCAWGAADLVSPRAQEMDVKIVLEVPDGLYVVAAPAALTRALVILFDNALAHSPRGSTITVTAAWPTVHALGSTTAVRIRVRDEGSGISGVDESQIFDRFTRSPDAGRRGFGLGLSLVQDVAERFGGTVTVEETSSSGTTFLLTLPQAG